MFLGKYEVLGQIGSGGFGRVLLARDSEQPDPASQLVAIKRLRRAKAQHKKLREAIEYEAEIGRYLSHPNIVRVIELTQVENDLLLVMEFINGIGLDELLDQMSKKGGALQPAAALEIAIQAGMGLHSAHRACSGDGTPLNIVHRDVKPSNIMVCKRGQVRIMDFGVALVAFRKVQTTTGTIKGTLRYLSPEQAGGSREIGPATDQFALGLVLGELLLGHPVYDGDHEHKILLKAMKGEVGEVLDCVEFVVPGMARVLGRALSFAQEDRFPTMAAFVDSLRGVAASVSDEEVDLAQLVHRGLEERARLAEEELDSFGLEASSGRLEGISVAAGGSTSNIFAAQPMGWAHEQLSALDGGVTDNEEEAAGWRLVSSFQDLSLRHLAPEPGEDDDGALVLSSQSKVIHCFYGEESQDGVLGLNDSTDIVEGKVPAGSAAPDASSWTSSDESRSEEAGGTAYAVTRPSRDVIGQRKAPARSGVDTTTLEIVVDGRGDVGRSWPGEEEDGAVQLLENAGVKRSENVEDRSRGGEAFHESTKADPRGRE